MFHGLEGLEAQKHGQFRAQRGGQKVYLPVTGVMPLLEYKNSLLSTSQNDANKEEPNQQREHTSGSRRASGEPKEIESIPRHLLGGLNQTEVMQQQLEVTNQAQHEQENEQISLLTNERDQLTRERDDLQQKITLLEQQWTEKLATITEERDKLLGKISQLHDTWETATEQSKGQLNQVSAERDGLEKQLDDERMENVALVDQFQDDRRRQSRQITELQQELAVAQQTSVELNRLRRRYSTLERAYQDSQSQSEHLHDSVNIPADDVHLSKTKLGGGSYGGEYRIN